MTPRQPVRIVAALLWLSAVIVHSALEDFEDRVSRLRAAIWRWLR